MTEENELVDYAQSNNALIYNIYNRWVKKVR